MQRLLTLADYNAPYLTFQPKYESSVLSVFAGMVKEGIVFRQLKPVHWSIANQTALAEAELEYMDKTSHSAAVKFNIPRIHSISLAHFMPSFGPPTMDITGQFSHCLWRCHCLCDCHHRWCPMHCCRRPIKLHKQYANRPKPHPSAPLIVGGLVAEHPFINRPSPLLPANLSPLTMELAWFILRPYHGNDDYLLGQSHGLDTYCPVLSDGTFDTSVPDWLQGQLI